MHEFFDIYTIVFLALAVFVIFRLRSVLGQRTGTERPPFDPFQRPEPPKADSTGNVIPLPTANARAQAAPDAPVAPDADAIIKELMPLGTPVADGLKTLMAADASFDPKQFVMGAKAAYEMIVLAFARGDRRALKDLLSKEVFDSFAGAISGRETRGEKVETAFVSIDKADIREAVIKGQTMLVTIRFASKLISATKDATGSIIDGNPDKIADLVDVWTFAREVTARDPNWHLVSTEAGH